MTETSDQTVTMDDTREIRELHSASLAGETIPTRVLMAPWGQVESANGSFVVDEEAAKLAVGAFDEHGTDLPIDYEHQTLGGTYASPTGKAPAAGWIKRIFAESGVGLLADIEWTDQAREMLGAKEYRYVSPVAIIRKSDRKLVAIHSAALTNKPAIVGMKPIVNRVEVVGDDEGEVPLAVLRSELDLPGDAGPEEILVAASRRIVDLRRDAGRRHVEERLREAMRAGKLVEAQRGWAEALVAREERLFDEWLRTAPVIVQPGSIVPPDGGNAVEGRQKTIASRARAQFRSSDLLSGVTSEEAFVADALRQAG